jgi:Family of unknown function (DUF6308)
VTSPVRPVALRHGVRIEDPLDALLRSVAANQQLAHGDPLAQASFGEPDLRLANRSGARISAREITAILERRRAIERALRAIAPEASLTGSADTVPWLALEELFDAFADIRGVGLSKITKALYRKRPALIPMLDSVVQQYLGDEDPGAQAAFGERALGLVRAYKRDLDRNRAAVRALKRELARRGYAITEVRILDLLIWSVQAASRGAAL